MVDKNKANQKKPVNSKKKKKLYTSERPIEVVIADEPPRAYISPRASLSASHSVHQSHNASTRVTPLSGHSISLPVMVPTSGYQTLQGYSHLGHQSTLPSASTSQSSAASGSVGLSGLRLGSGGSSSNTTTTQHSDAHGPRLGGLQSGDKDHTQRLIIEPIGYRLFPDEGMTKIILNCIGLFYNDMYPTWGSIPLNIQGQIFIEFRKYYVWAPEHENKVQSNFKYRAGKVLSGLFSDCRAENRVPSFVVPDMWAKLLNFWKSDEKFLKRREIGKKARASDKGGSLHTGGAISQLTRKKRMEKDLGRPVTQEELFKVCHTKTPKDSTDESWCETRAQQTHESFVQRIQEYRSTQPPESQDTPLTDEQVEQFWRESAGEPVRGSVYGYTQKAFAEKKPWFYCPSSSGFDNVDKAVVSVMKEEISMLTAELAASTEREKKRDEQIAQIAASKEIENKRYAELQSQLKSLFESGKIIPHCASDKRRCLVDESDIEGEEGEEDEDEDANDE